MVDSNEYDDQYLAVSAPQIFRMIFDVEGCALAPLTWTTIIASITCFSASRASCSVTAGREVFTDQDYGRVSDHCGYLMTFEPK